jgi:acetyl esterase
VDIVIAVQAWVVQLFGGLVSRPRRNLRFRDIPKKTSILRVPTTAGQVTCTVYRPPTAEGAAPVYVNFHGGGFVIRRPENDDHICRYIAAKAGCVVVNVGYDTAPQRPFPTAPTQAYEVTRWVAANGGRQGWDGARLAVGGHSAGGNLAAGVCLTARDRGEFAPLLQILDYPPLDLSIDAGDKRARIDKPMLTPRLSRIFDGAYTPDPATRRDPHAFTHAGPPEPAKEAIALMADALRKAFAGGFRFG